MKNESIQSVVQGWDTVRFELLKSRISDLQLKVARSPVEPMVQRLYRELEVKKIRFRPPVYLTNEWGCPDRTPVIGIPFYLADERLYKLEEEQNGDIEDSRTIMMLLRHEAGHAVNYAYRLWRRPSWVEIFGPFTKPYRDIFRPQKLSRNYVKHIEAYPYGRTYAQKHPDEDFAETFAVWMTPRSGWRKRYRNWPALRKLVYVDRLMKEIRRRPPECLTERKPRSVETMNITLAEHYGKKAERFRRAARGYVDDRLKEVFTVMNGGTSRPASALIKQHEAKLREKITRWSMLDQAEAESLLRKLVSRADALKLGYRLKRKGEVLMDLMAMTIALAMDYSHTGRFTG